MNYGKKVPVLKPLHKAPIGGWVFKDPSGYEFKSTKKDSYEALDSLVASIIHYRKGHRLPYDDVRNEILVQIEEKNPDMFYWVDGETRNPTEEEIILLDKAIDLYNGELKYAIKGDQDRRIKSCESCPLNRPIPFENKEYDHMVFHITRGFLNHDLGYCTFYNHDNRVACLLEGKPSESSPDPDCWANYEGKK